MHTPSRNDDSVPGGSRVLDHSVYGLATVRLIDPPAAAAAAVERELGRSEGPASPEPDICVRFTDSVLRKPGLRLLDRGQAGYDEGSFYLFDRGGHATRLEMDQLGQRVTVVCGSGVGSVPLLVPMLALRLLALGHVLLHSAAFVYDGTGVLVAGWKKGGKTELLLPFMAQGAHYLSDEWTIITTGGQLYGLTAALHLWSWHLRQLPQYWARVSPGDRRRIRLLRTYQRMYRAVPNRMRGRGAVADVFDRASQEGGVSAVGQARVAPETVFGDHVWRGPARLDRVFLAGVSSGETTVSPIDAQEVGRRMVASLAYERAELMTAYHQYRFAFPDRRNELIETAREREAQILAQALDGVPACEVTHPYPVRLHDLFTAAEPWCR